MAIGGLAVLVLRDGVRVPVRPIRAEDAAALQRLVGRSSDRSIELRFFGPLKELSDEMAERFADVDGTDRYALVALDPDDEDEIVGVVRYAREEGTEGAEYAALIEDRFQGRGLGLGLTKHLIEAARENGIRHLHALVMRENIGMLSLLRSLGLPERERWQDGAEHVEIDLRPDAAA
ncbi:MAG TPA: GNAT family N-acetyltransferase [Rubrobacter sp.]|nr:GNAT family N-acetyltransferase [Rubrobacter sp.]